MSRTADGQRIVCDGAGCTASAHPPVALRTVLDAGSAKRDAAVGWLFVTQGETERHYCPSCARWRLHSPADPIEHPGRSG